MKTLAGASAAVLSWLSWKALRADNRIAASNKTETQLALNFAEGCNFTGAYIVFNNKVSIRVFRNRCTHLGCAINRFDGQELICPCHGSHFDEQGRVTRGPATRNLAAVPFRIDKEKKLLVLADEL